MKQSILVLGGTSDVAIALAKKYLAHGYKIYLAGRNRKELETTATDLMIRSEGEVKVLSFEATNYQSHAKLLAQCDELPDVTFAVFGYLGDQKKAEDDWAECERILDTNYKGAVSILNHVANAYEKEGRGVIVGISSVAGERGRQSNYFYGSAKAGFTAYLSGLRNRLFSSSVHVLTVKPGFMATKMTAGMRLPGPLTANPDHVARSIYKAVKRKTNTLYTLSSWRPIMYIIKSIPEGIFKRLKL